MHASCLSNLTTCAHATCLPCLCAYVRPGPCGFLPSPHSSLHSFYVPVPIHNIHSNGRCASLSVCIKYRNVCDVLQADFYDHFVYVSLTLLGLAQPEGEEDDDDGSLSTKGTIHFCTAGPLCTAWPCNAPCMLNSPIAGICSRSTHVLRLVVLYMHHIKTGAWPMLPFRTLTTHAMAQSTYMAGDAGRACRW